MQVQWCECKLVQLLAVRFQLHCDETTAAAVKDPWARDLRTSASRPMAVQVDCSLVQVQDITFG